jgi:ribosomal protein L21E
VATGASAVDVVSTKRIDVKGYNLGDELKIYVDPSVDKAIRHIPRLLKKKYSGNISDDIDDIIAG